MYTLDNAEEICTNVNSLLKVWNQNKSFILRACVKFPINLIVWEISVHIIDENIIMLLSLAALNRLGIHFHNLKNHLVRQPASESTFIERCHGHRYLIVY